MLQLAGTPFTTGVLNYRDESDAAERPHASIYIPVNFRLGDGLTISRLAFVDTGAPWLFIGPDLIEALELAPVPGSQLQMMTRFGRKTGFLTTVDLVIPAEDGESLHLEATAFACPDWEQGIFLGYVGCMAKMNFAVQPQSNRFFFGAPT